MADVLFQHAARATVGTVQVDGLDMVFRVEKSLKKEPNTLELEIFNLNETSRAAMQKKGANIVLLAGYRGKEFQQIFQGAVRHASSRLDGQDWVTKITSGDAEKEMKFAQTSASFPPNSSFGDVLKSVGGSLGVNPGNLDDAAAGLADETVASGYTSHGRASKELDRLTKAKGLTWSVQDGELQILGPKEASKKPALSLSADSGLIGSPEVVTPENEKETGCVKVRALLRGVYLPGKVVVLASKTISGNFRIEKVSHRGDTAGQDWYSDLELKPF